MPGRAGRRGEYAWSLVGGGWGGEDWWLMESSEAGGEWMGRVGGLGPS